MQNIAGQSSVFVPGSERHVRGNDAFLKRLSVTSSLDNRSGFLNTNTTDENSVRWIQDRMDDLDVRIAMRDFEEAVKSIEKGTSSHMNYR